MNDLFINKSSCTPELNPLPNVRFGQNSEMYNRSSSISFTSIDKLPHRLFKRGKSGDGEDYIASINKTPNSKELENYIRPTKGMSDSFLAADFKFGLKNGISAGRMFADDPISNRDARKYAEIFVDHLMIGNGKTWHDDGVLSDGMRKTPEVKTFIKKICTDLKSAMKLRFGYFWNIQFSKRKYKNISFSFSSSPTLKGLVGGTQKTSVFINGIRYDECRRTWFAALSLHIEDDFGVSESDVITPRGFSAQIAKPMLADFWVLQKQRGKKPFTTVFEIPFYCSGNY